MFPHISRKYKMQVSVIANICKSLHYMDYIHFWRAYSSACSSNTRKTCRSFGQRQSPSSCSCLCRSRNLGRFTTQLTQVRPYTLFRTTHMLETHQNSLTVKDTHTDSHHILWSVLVRNYSDVKDDKMVKGWVKEIREDFENEHKEKVGASGLECAEDSGYDSDKSEQSASSSDHVESSSSESDSSDSDIEVDDREKILHKIMSDAHSAEVLGLTSDELLKIYRLSKVSEYKATSHGIDISDFEHVDEDDDRIEILDKRIANKYRTIDQHIDNEHDEDTEPVRLRNISNSAEIKMDNSEEVSENHGEKIAYQNMSSNAKEKTAPLEDLYEADTETITFENIRNSPDTIHDVHNIDEVESDRGNLRSHSSDMKGSVTTEVDETIIFEDMSNSPETVQDMDAIDEVESDKSNSASQPTDMKDSAVTVVDDTIKFEDIRNGPETVQDIDNIDETVQDIDNIDETVQDIDNIDETVQDIDNIDEIESDGSNDGSRPTDMTDSAATGEDDSDRIADSDVKEEQRVVPKVPEIEIEDFVNLPEEEEVEEAWIPPVPLTRGEAGVYTVEDLVTVLEHANAVDIAMIRIPAHIDFADYMAIVSAKSYRHMKAIVADVKWIYKAKKKRQDKFMRVEGIDTSKDWFAMDLGNIILHIFMPETREVYDLEMLWTVGPQFDEKCKEAADPYVFSVDQLPWLEELESQSEVKDNDQSQGWDNDQSETRKK